LTRRSFLKKTSLVISVGLISGDFTMMNLMEAQAGSNEIFKPHAFLEIATDNTVTIWVGQTNLGQGTHTGIPMVIADELDAAWDSVQVKAAPAAEPFKDPVWKVQATGGSTSIRHRWDMLRKVGAAARQMMKQAAAQKWQIPVEKCQTRDSRVIHPDGMSESYAELAQIAATLPVPENPPLKSLEDYHIIGTQRARFDIPDKVMGKTVYGMDFTLPNMCVAVVARAPFYRARPQSYDTDAAMAVKGVIKVIPLEGRIAVCANTTFAAIRGRDALSIKWSKGSMPDLNDKTMDRIYQDYLNKKGAVAKNSGDAEAVISNASKTVEASFKIPHISHAQVEPINCTAHVEKDGCRIWAPTQGPTVFQMIAANLTGLPVEKIHVEILPAGGGFGLRSEADPLVDAVLLSITASAPGQSGKHP
jgi:isoquinoline 1-oxidoreductase beta subunit